MLIVISGGSTTAEFLISTMLEHKHRVVVIEEDRDTIEHLAEALPPQVMIVEGDGCDSTVQLDAGVDDADLFVALMGHDDTNLVACELAMTNFRVPRCIATVNSPKNERIFREVGIEPVSSTKIIARMVDEEAAVGGMRAVLPMTQGDVMLIAVTLPRKLRSKEMVRAGDLPYRQDIRIVGTVRDGAVTMASDDTVLRPGETVLAAVKEHAEQELKTLVQHL